MRILVLVDDLDVVQLYVEVLVHRMKGSTDG